MGEYDLNKVLDAIRTINEQTILAKEHEPDDFNYSLFLEIDKVAQKGLWHLTRGQEGTPDKLKLWVEE